MNIHHKSSDDITKHSNATESIKKKLKDKEIEIEKPTVKLPLTEKERLLLKACELGDIDQIYKLIWNGTNINCSDPITGTNPISVACQYGKSTVVSLLIKFGANVNTKNEYGVTPMHWAANNDDSKIVKLLMSKGKMSVSDLSTKDSFGATPLHFASCRNLHENVSVLLSAGCNPNITNNDLKKPSDVTTNSDIMYSLQNEEARLAEEIAKQTKRPVTSGKKKRKQSAKTIQRVSPSKSKSSNSIDMVARSKSSVTLTTKSKEDTKSSTPKTPISTKIKSKPKLVDSNPKLTDSLLKSANQISQPTSQKNSNGDVSQLKSFQNGLFHDVEELAGELKDGMTIKKVTNKPKVTVA